MSCLRAFLIEFSLLWLGRESRKARSVPFVEPKVDHNILPKIAPARKLFEEEQEKKKIISSFLSVCITLLTLPYHEFGEESCRARGNLGSRGTESVHVVKEGKRGNALHNSCSLPFSAHFLCRVLLNYGFSPVSILYPKNRNEPSYNIA